MKILANEALFPLGDFSCHASHFEFLPDGSLFAVWFQGTAEGNDDVCIYGARRVNGHWDTPRRLSPEDGLPHWNPVLHQTNDGRLLLFYKAGREIGTWRTEVMASTDGGASFSPPRELVPGDAGGRGPVRNKILVASDGAWLAPASTETDGWKAFVDRSEDGGRTWTRGADVLLPEACLRPHVPVDPARRGLIQPSLWEDPKRPGHISTLLRSTEGFIFRADSEDFGRSFGPAYPTGVPNNNSGLDLDRLPDGRLLLACTPVGVASDGVWGARTPLSLLESRDNGRTFSLVTEIETGEGTFAYPALRCRDGRVHLTYTWNRRLIRYVCLEI